MVHSLQISHKNILNLLSKIDSSKSLISNNSKIPTTRQFGFSTKTVLRVTTATRITRAIQAPSKQERSYYYQTQSLKFLLV
jgi:hypothetical protein